MAGHARLLEVLIVVGISAAAEHGLLLLLSLLFLLQMLHAAVHNLNVGGDGAAVVLVPSIPDIKKESYACSCTHKEETDGDKNISFL